MRIIPAMDIIDGKCVRLTQGDFGTKRIYNEDPLEVARSFEDRGLEYLHFVDLDGARAGRPVHYRLLERLASRTSLSIDYGGGIGSEEDLRIAFESGATQVTGGSLAVREPGRFISWLRAFSGERIILGADARDGKVAISGWEEDTQKALLPFIKGFVKEGARYVICTDIGKDGMLSGPATGLYTEILQENPDLNLIASGGIGKLEDLVALEKAGCEGAIIGRAIYEGRISLKELEKFILNPNEIC